MSALTSTELSEVAAFLRMNGMNVSNGMEATQIAGGRSNVTIRLDDGTSTWVLRMPPRVGRTPSAHDVAREFRVTRGLHGSGIPVPEPVALCEDETILGAPFAVTRFVEGRTMQTRLDLDELSDGALQAVTFKLLATLANLHKVNADVLGLRDFGRADGYTERQVKRWTQQWLIVAGPDASLRRHGESLAARLAAEIPQRHAAAIVHGDFRIDNTLLTFAPEPEIAAVVDWELSTLGDPVADVAMMCAYRHSAFDLIVGAPSAWASERLPDVAALVAGYERASGVPLKDFDFHLALAYFKIAVIAAGIHHRYQSGAGHGAGFDSAYQAVAPLLSAGLETLAAKQCNQHS